MGHFVNYRLTELSDRQVPDIVAFYVLTSDHRGIRGVPEVLVVSNNLDVLSSLASISALTRHTLFLVCAGGTDQLLMHLTSHPMLILQACQQVTILDKACCLLQHTLQQKQSTV